MFLNCLINFLETKKNEKNKNTTFDFCLYYSLLTAKNFSKKLKYISELANNKLDEFNLYINNNTEINTENFFLILSPFSLPCWIPALSSSLWINSLFLSVSRFLTTSTYPCFFLHMLCQSLQLDYHLCDCSVSFFSINCQHPKSRGRICLIHLSVFSPLSVLITSKNEGLNGYTTVGWPVPVGNSM